jgi:hypothetical protein
MKVGGSPARVKSIVGNVVTIDDGIETGVGSYGYTFRSPSGIFTGTLTVNSSDTFTLSGPELPQVGDLIIIGIVGQITFDCIVKSINPNDDLSASIVLIEKADGVLTHEYADTFPDYSPLISITSDADFAPPGEVTSLAVVSNTWESNGNGYDYKIGLDWDVPSGGAFEVYEVWVDHGRGYNLEVSTKESEYIYLADEENLGKEHSFKVLAVSATGKKLELGQVTAVTATPLRKTSHPSNVSSFDIDITGEVLQLFWTQVTDSDIDEYLIRYSPVVIGATWEASVPLLRVDKNTTLASTQARVGTYLIKAVDFNQNESYAATTAVTTIPELFNLNVIDTITDFPGLTGPKDRVDFDGSSLMLKKSVVGDVNTTVYYSEGYYYYNNLLDLGDIYTVRLQSQILAEGFTLADLMSNWITLDDVTTMSTASHSQWAVEMQYRTTEQLNVMSEWSTLSSLVAMSSGAEDIWSPWRSFTIGDATGRIFQFRLKLISNSSNVTPRVYAAEVKADMPDRVESYDNVVAPNTGAIITYSPAFKGPGTTPAIQVSMSNAQSGDYWTFDYKTLDGFKIKFFDKNDVAVSRTFDAVIKGYGRKASAAL